MTVKEIISEIKAKLSPVVGSHEAEAMAYAIMDDVRGYSKVDCVLYGHRELLPDTVERIHGIVDKVIAGVPLQYAVGQAYFHGRKFAVTADVLIPRPETSQLVDIIEDQWRGKGDISILDIGTGSGCIAITLALDLWPCTVDAIDISADALAIARKNANYRNANVRMELRDALSLRADSQAYDVIVSNPPYVLESEKAEMDGRVKDHEPHLALFVPDDDALKYYAPIARYAIDALRDGGKLYFEINPKKADEMKRMLQSIGFGDVEIVCDYRQRRRFAIASK